MAMLSHLLVGATCSRVRGLQHLILLSHRIVLSDHTGEDLGVLAQSISVLNDERLYAFEISQNGLVFFLPMADVLKPHGMFFGVCKPEMTRFD